MIILINQKYLPKQANFSYLIQIIEKNITRLFQIGLR